MDFSIFKNRYRISGNLEVLTALHIGSGIEENGFDAPFITVDGDSKNKNFYIPGSSFRGYLSTKLERLVNKDNSFKLIDTETKEELNEADVKLIFGYTNLLKKEKDKMDKNNKKEKFIEDEKVIKRVLKEFLDNETIERALKDNSNEKNKDEKKKNEEAFEEAKKYSSMAGRIHISDMLIISDVKSIKRDGIKIDRETGATKNGGKFDYNVIPLCSKFKFEMELDNVKEYQLDLIKLALKDIREGDLFGGKLSRGIGKCKLNVEKIEYVEKADIEDYLFKNLMRTKNIKEITEIKNLKIK